MQNRVSLWIKCLLTLVLIGLLILFYNMGRGKLILRNASTGEIYAEYPVQLGDSFSIGFIHSVNKSPVIDFYEIKDDGIYVEKTIYYNFGAGVETELSDNEELSYGEDGSMIVSGFDKKISPLVYFVGTVSDHTLELHDESISLRDLCGRNSRVEFLYQANLNF